MLGELCDVEGGNAAPQGDEHFRHGTIPFVRMKDLGRPHFTNNLTETDDKLTEISATANRMKFFEPGCILFPRSGSVALNHRAILGVRACVVSHIGVLQNLRPEITARYLYLYLTTFDMTALSKKTTGVDSIAFADVKRIPVPVPPLLEQERMADLLDEADDLRKLRARADRRTADLISAVFNQMFGDLSPGRSRWPGCAVSEVADVQGGLQVTSRRNQLPLRKPYLRVANVQRGFMILDEIKEIGLTREEFSRTRLQRGDVLLVEGNGNPQEIGRAAVWEGNVEDMVHQNHLIRVRPIRNCLDSTFLLTFINSAEGKSYFRGTGVTTSGLVTISTSKVKGCRIPVPPVSLQRGFASRVAEIRKLEVEQNSSRTRLDALFQSMLYRAFSREL